VEVAPGTIIGGVFRVEGRLGAGGMGVVYQATHLKLERPVALKLHLAQHADASRLEREARAMARLNDPHVIGVYDVGTWRSDDGHEHVFIAMELCDAGTLRRFIAQRPHWQRALQVCRQAGEGLAAAHVAGLVHRDFKPDNVLLGSDGRVRVADFGLARAIETSPASSPADLGGPSPALLASPSDQLTRTGAIVGTPAYMAPEQFGGGNVDARADQFAFCVVTYEALWGVRPFDGRTAGELLYRITITGPTRPELGPIPAGVWTTLARGLDPEPSQRFESMRSLLYALDQAARVRGPSPALLAAVIAIPVVLVGGGLAAYLLAKSPAAESPRVAAAPEVDPDLARPVLAAEPVSPVAPEPVAPEPIVPETPRDNLDSSALDDLAANNGLQDPLATMRAIEEADAQGASDFAIGIALAQGLMPTPAPADATPTTPAWDTSKTLTCGSGDNFLIQGKTLDIAKGPAFQVTNGCRLRIRDCTVTAPVFMSGHHATVEIEDATVTVTERVLDLAHTAVTIAGLESTAKVRGDAVVLSYVTGTIAEMKVHGDTAIRAEYGTDVDLRMSEIEGDAHAIQATGSAILRLTDTTLHGAVTRGPGAKIIDAAAE
jgi:hypothetical protein